MSRDSNFSEISKYLREIQRNANMRNGRDKDETKWNAEIVHFYDLLGLIAKHFE